MRASFDLRILLVPALAACALQCGGAEGSRPVAAPTTSSSAEVASSLVPVGADPICGSGHRWSGNKCAQVEEEKSSPTERKTAALARERKAGDGLIVEDVVIGGGREVRAGDIVKVHYTGTLLDGSTFDSSRSQGTPFEFRVGQRQVIPGFDRGILGMKVGGRRKVTIPHQLGYGIDGSPPRIPPKATLIFDLELIDVM